MEIALIEPYCDGWTHAPINAALCVVCANAVPHGEVEFFAEPLHVYAIKALLKKRVYSRIANIKLIATKRNDNQCQFWRRVSREFFFLKNLLERHKPENLVVASSGKEILWAIYLLSGFGWLKNTKVTTLLHSEAKYCVGWISRNPVTRALSLRNAINMCVRKGVRIVVLEEFIRRELTRHWPQWGPILFTLEHPVWCVGETAPPIHTHGVIRFGFLGLASKAKGFDKFVDVARRIKSIYRDKVEFHAIGSMGRDHFSTAELDQVLDTVPSEQKLERTEYDRLVRMLNFVVMPYRPMDYNLCASGALLDAIAFNKPIVAWRQPLFADLFDRYGDFGVLYEGDDGLFRAIVSILSGERSLDFDGFSRVLSSIRDDRQPERLALVMRKILS